MSNVVLAGLVKTAVAELVNEQKPFNLALVLSRIPVQSDTVIDLDFVETQMNKLFYNEEMADFEISIVDGDIVYAPMMMSNQQISDALSVSLNRRLHNVTFTIWFTAQIPVVESDSLCDLHPLSKRMAQIRYGLLPTVTKFECLHTSLAVLHSQSNTPLIAMATSS